MKQPPATLVALHKHWVVADSINFNLRRAAHKTEPGAPDKVSMQFSMFCAVTVWYSLLYVVIEGYQELRLSDSGVDELLADSEKVEALRRFRNATFHYQRDPLGPKFFGFLEAKESEKWVQKLNSALKAFFEKELPVREVAESLGL